MIIGIDIDDTLVDTSTSFDKVIKKYNVNFNKKFKDDWTLEERNFIFGKYLEEILIGAKLKKDAKEVLDSLVDLGYELVVITARSNRYCKNIEQQTIELIKKENLPITKLYFGENKKSDLAKKINLGLMIDDSVYVCNNMKEEEIDYILFGDKITTWKEVLEYIKDREVNNG